MVSWSDERPGDCIEVEVEHDTRPDGDGGPYAVFSIRDAEYEICCLSADGEPQDCGNLWLKVLTLAQAEALRDLMIRAVAVMRIAQARVMVG